MSVTSLRLQQSLCNVYHCVSLRCLFLQYMHFHCAVHISTYYRIHSCHHTSSYRNVSRPDTTIRTVYIYNICYQREYSSSPYQETVVSRHRFGTDIYFWKTRVFKFKFFFIRFYIKYAKYSDSSATKHCFCLFFLVQNFFYLEKPVKVNKKKKCR